MFIEIERDIIEDAIVKGGQDSNESRDLLILMALCAKQGKHYVYVPCLRESTELVNKLSALLGCWYVASLDYTNRERDNSQKLKRKLSIRAVLTYQRHKPENGVILLNPLDIRRFEPWTETYLLVENVLDAQLYQLILNYYKEKEHLTPCQVSFYPLMGGGATTCNVLQHEISLGQHFCLAISDSDMKVPPGWESCKPGETAVKMMELMENNPFNCHVYVLQRLMEIENLLPAKLVRKYASSPRGCTKILQMDFSLFDMKKGLTFASLFEDSIAIYWKEIIDDEQDKFIVRDKLKRDYPRKSDYDAKAKTYPVIKEGFGENLLKRVLGECDTMNSNEKAKAKDDLKNIRRGDLSTFQQKEWNDIGEVMFAWTCGRKAK